MNTSLYNSFISGATQIGALFPSVDIPKDLENIEVGTTDTSPCAAWADVEQSFEEAGICIRESMNVFGR